jgi:NADPH:quinone reductase-like Zn-dependent oxidoreductase
MKTRAIVFHEFGEPTVLVDEPAVIERTTPDEVLVKVLATSVNHLDLDIRNGSSRLPVTLPHVLGREVVGEVAEGPDEDPGRFPPGMRVLVAPNAPCGKCASCLRGRANLCQDAYMPGITGWGGYAEHIVVPARALIALPDLDPVTAAATPISFGTAWRMLYTVGQLQPGEWVLVSGAAGGLGHAAVQVARLGGARVVGLIGDPSKADFVLECGAEAVVSTHEADWPRLARDATGGHGFDLAVEHIGGQVFSTVVELIHPTGRIMVGGGHAGEHPSLDDITTSRNELRLLGVRSQRPDEIRRVLDLAARGVIRPHVDRVLPLEGAAQAHRALADRTVRGKQVLTP